MMRLRHPKGTKDGGRFAKSSRPEDTPSVLSLVNEDLKWHREFETTHGSYQEYMRKSLRHPDKKNDRYGHMSKTERDDLLNMLEADWEKHEREWPKRPDEYDYEHSEHLHLDATREEVDFVWHWMRDNYEDAVTRYETADINKDDAAEIISWGYDDPYSGPLMRGYTGMTKEEIIHNKHATTISTMVSLVEGGKFAPSYEEWKCIYDEIQGVGK